ncbi:MAG: AAA family ATPase [Planctomycetota bacterium]
MDDSILEISHRLVREVLEPMKRAFVDKDEVVDLLGVALVGREHLFLHGPPGTAKSALVHDLGRRLDGTTFDYLLTRFTEPSELFGPFDIRRLREGDLVTNTEGMLPEAEIVFLDELLNANSAILNSLLGVLNERVLRRGREMRRLPLLMAVGASNHLPEDDALGALFDRFLLRVGCENVDDDRLGEVLDAGWRLESTESDGGAALGIADVARLAEAIPDVDLAPAREAFVDLVRAIRRAGIELSDRRAVKMQRVVASSALLAGRPGALPSDLWVFRHAWETEEQREVLAALVEAALEDVEKARAHPRAREDVRPDPEALARDLDAIEASLEDEDATARTRALDALQLLAGRAEWVVEAASRDHLVHRIRALRERAAG